MHHFKYAMGRLLVNLLQIGYFIKSVRDGLIELVEFFIHIRMVEGIINVRH